MLKIVAILLPALLAVPAVAATSAERRVTIDDQGSLALPVPNDRPGLMDQMRADRHQREVERRIIERENAARMRSSDADRLRELNELRDERNRIERGR